MNHNSAYILYLNNIRALISSSWKNTSFLAVTKRNEATGPFGHTEKIISKAGNETIIEHEAVAFSLMGAIMRETGCPALLNNLAGDINRLLLNTLNQTAPYSFLQHWEEVKGRTKEDILKLIDDTILIMENK